MPTPTEREIALYVLQHPNCLSRDIASHFGVAKSVINRKTDGRPGIYGITYMSHNDHRHTIIDEDRIPVASQSQSRPQPQSVVEVQSGPGYQEGRQDGYHVGYQDGQQVGYQAGLQSPNLASYQNGYQDGFQAAVDAFAKRNPEPAPSLPLPNAVEVIDISVSDASVQTEPVATKIRLRPIKPIHLP